MKTDMPLDAILRVFVIDTHETRVQEEYITQLQIELKIYRLLV